ncbi:hypothetical protein BP6252_08774 [Coleophoma cylindrospora]|uniref:Uncharacterized protein n=1 Tax=Coleophoma cylindrospora TaxID=1849047 RepID=A0A3D8R7E7_9HELO|nr:hypothetical protein BP6252_08774 [Coleophoma cylindrospora]
MLMNQILGVSPEPCKEELPRQLLQMSLPPKSTVFLRGNFMLLDQHVSRGTQSPMEESSYVDIAFGDDRKRFAGFHRFEIMREGKPESSSGATIWYSCIACNPSVDRYPFPGWTFTLHKFYAIHLFRDGIAEILKDEM